MDESIHPDEELFVPYSNLNKVIRDLAKAATDSDEDRSSLANWFRKELSHPDLQGEYMTENGLEEGVFISGSLIEDFQKEWHDEQTSQAIRSLVNDGLVEVLWDSNQNDFVFKAIANE